MTRTPTPKPSRVPSKIKLDADVFLKRLSRIVVNVDTNNQPWSVLLERDPRLQPLFLVSDGMKPGGAIKALKNGLICWCCGKLLTRNSVCSVCRLTDNGKQLLGAIWKWKRSNSMRSKSPEEKAEHLAKMQATTRERYGVDNPYQAESVKDKIKKIHRKNLGVDYPVQNKEVQRKQRESLLKNYPSGIASEPIQEKIRQTNLERRGVTHQMKDPEVKAKVAATNLKRYGGTAPIHSSKVADKISRSSMNKYGVVNPLLNKDVQAKRKATLFKNYGARVTPFELESMKVKSRETSMRRLGVPHYMQDSEHFSKHLKAKFKRKEVVINGCTHIVQGYEKEVLELLAPRIRTLVTDPTKLPRIDWSDSSGKAHKYFPDALILTKDGRKILLEVKSSYTILGEGVLRKAEAAWQFCSRLPSLIYLIALYENGQVRWATNLSELKRLQV